MADEQYLRTSKSNQLYNRACKVLPAGVSYFIRYFEPYPFYVQWAKGSKIKDVDDNIYVDYWMGHYTHILGHSPPQIVAVVERQIKHGTHYGVCHELEVVLAEKIVKLVPSAQMVRFTNSGTEAAMYAVRLCRSYSHKDKIVKFEGGWHGGYDALHVAVKPPFDVPESDGLTREALKNTIVAPFNNLEETERIIRGEKVGGIVVEPVLGAGGCIPAEKEFLEGLRELCTENDILLIFDEIITGFRLSPGGAQQFYRVTPDVTILGKVLGGGFPIGAVTGRIDVMERMNQLRFERPSVSFQGGTFTANPVSLSAGLEMLKILEDGTIISRLNSEGDKFRSDLFSTFENGGVCVTISGAGSLFRVHFTNEPIMDVRGVLRSDQHKLEEYHRFLISNGVFMLPGKSGSISDSHSREDLQKLIQATERYTKQR